MSRRDAYARTRSFIETCTEPVGAINCRFRVHHVPELAPILRLERELERRFGRHGEIQQERIDDALDFLDDIDPQPTNPWGMAPIWFSVTCNFRILDPAAKRPLPGQDPGRFRGVEYERGQPLGSSRLGLMLHNQATLALDLCIPDADDGLLGRVVPWLQQSLPCRLSQKHWRAWTPTKTGSFKGRRLAAPNVTLGNAHRARPGMSTSGPEAPPSGHGS
jgi:hypothetical protein